MATKFRYPTGARPLLIEEAARRRRVESQFVAALEERGFAEVVLPIIDFAEPYATLTGADAARQSYRFTDRDGELVTVRSDFTPMVARALAPTIADRDLPLRVFYRGDVVRCSPSRLGANSELFQIGAEIVGDGSVECDIEVLQSAFDIARSFLIEPLVVYTDASVVQQLCDAYGPDVREALLAKRSGRDLPPLVDRLISGSATAADLFDFAPAIAQRLTRIGAALDADRFRLQLDDVDRTDGYYTGLRFRLYGGDSPRAIAQGGRYDSLYGRFGTAAPAVGFTFTLDDLD